MRFSSKIVMRVAAIGVAAAAIGLPATAAQARPNVIPTGTVTVTPHTQLANGQSVTVSGTGFTDSESVLIVECQDPTTQSTCDETAPVASSTNGSGAFSQSFTVKTGAVGTNGTCAVGGSCFIAAETYTTDPTAPDSDGAGQISFAPLLTITPSTNLTNNQSVSVTGTGFSHSESVLMVECQDPTNQATCDETAPTASSTDGTGSFTQSFTVKTGAVGTGTCAVGATCYIAAETYTTNPAAPDSDSAGAITFATGLPIVTADPNTDLVNNSVVTVHGTGFPHSMPASVVECSALTGIAACNVATVVTPAPITSATGTFTTTIKVKTGAAGTGTCNAGETCYIAVTTDPADPTDTAAAGAAQITFKPAVVPPPIATATPNSGLKNGQTVTVKGSRFPQHSTTLFVVECNANLLKAAPKGGQDACDDSTLNTTGKTNAKGSFSGLKFKVETGTVGTGAAAGTCGVGHPCFIAVTTTLSGALADSAAAPISFGTAKTKTAAHASAKKVKVGKTFTISGTEKSAGKGIKGAKVVLYERAKGSKAWHKVKTYTTKAGGKFKTGKLKGKKKTEQYLVKHKKGATAGFSYGASQSKIITVKK